MTYLKATLSGFAAVFFGLIAPGLFNLFRGVTEHKATGEGAVAGGFAAAFLNPLFWILAVGLFLAFRAASRLKSVPLRALFFWIPTIIALVMVMTTSALFLYSLRILKSKAGS